MKNVFGAFISIIIILSSVNALADVGDQLTVTGAGITEVNGTYIGVTPSPREGTVLTYGYLKYPEGNYMIFESGNIWWISDYPENYPVAYYRSEGGAQSSEPWELSWQLANNGVEPIPTIARLCEWNGETAWSLGDLYLENSNWATYTPYAGVEKIVGLLANQDMNAGTVTFSEINNGQVTITITLNDGWQFTDVVNNIKIQDYEDAPEGNKPKIGHFDWKGDADSSPYEITVPANNFYGIHVDLEWNSCLMPE